MSTTNARSIDRRTWLKTAAVTAAAATAGLPVAAAPESPPADFRIRHGRIRQSIMGWTYGFMPVPELAQVCKSIGLVAMEGVDAKHYPGIRALGLEISLVDSHGFRVGPCETVHHALVEQKLREAIDRAVAVDCSRVITFTGYREPGSSDEQRARNCVEGWKRVIGYAEEKNITLCLEHLNSRDASHPMKGHPGYFGDDVELCIDLIKRVDSPRMKLLFDIYHVQIMHGDVIRRLRQYQSLIGHYHTAGVPGRGELDQTQEVNYPAVMQAILDTGYTGYVAQEFLPTWTDRVAALRHAASVCDV